MTDTGTETSFYGEFFSVELDEEDNKQVHIYGYLYTEGESITENPKETWRSVEYCWFIIPMTEIVKRGIHTVISEDEASCKQYIYDLTEEQAKESRINYFGDKNGSHSGILIDGDELNEKTPIGDYELKTK